MISFITIGRDDDYGERFLDRLYLSISKNIESIIITFMKVFTVDTLLCTSTKTI